MSFELVDKVLDSGIKDPTGIRVLVAIAKVINSSTKCWRISLSDLSRLSRTSPNSLAKTLKKYEEEGILIIKRGKDPNRRNLNLTNVYSINEDILDQKYPSNVLMDRGSLKNEGSPKFKGTPKNEGTGSPKNEGTGSLKNERDISNDKEDISNTLSGERVHTPNGQDFFQNFENQGQQTDIPTKNESTPKAQKTSRKKKAAPFPWGDEFPEELQDLKANPKYATLIIEDEYEKFMNYYKSHGKPMADWRRAFISWLLKAKEFQKERVLNQTQQKPKKVPQKENFNEPGRWDGFVGADGTML